MLGTDTFTDTTSQHRPQVEPDTFSFGSPIVATFQAGRFFSGGASGIDWATPVNGCSNWTWAILPGTTKVQDPCNRYARASDPSVAHDARDGVWLV